MKKYYIQSWKQRYPTSNKTKANWTGHILHRGGLLKHATEGKIECISDGERRKKIYVATG